MLATTALVAGYERDLPIVRGIDFALGANELVVILGPNGAGKSTFVKAIAGLVPIHAGTAMLGDVDITSVPAEEKLRHGLAGGWTMDRAALRRDAERFGIAATAESLMQAIKQSSINA